MQVRAILSGVRAAMAKDGEPVALEIMVPFVSSAHEVAWVRERVMSQVDAAQLPPVVRERFAFGTMIELPRAALVADEIAVFADFFSFGTNDLTQTTMGLSRDDAGRFLPFYVESGLLPADPFASLDTTGVGKLVKMGTELGRKQKPGLKVGVCGEHGGDPSSIAFFAEAGLDYVSCSPFRVPVARLAAAQAAARQRALD